VLPPMPEPEHEAVEEEAEEAPKPVPKRRGRKSVAPEDAVVMAAELKKRPAPEPVDEVRLFARKIVFNAGCVQCCVDNLLAVNVGDMD
jgi:hypothetical protein